MPAEPIRVVLRGDEADCGVVSICMYTGFSYADVMREILRHDSAGGAKGLRDSVIRRTLAGLGSPVRWTSKVDYEDDHGLLRLSDHLVVLFHGVVVEPSQSWCGIWSVDTYIESSGFCKRGKDNVLGIYLPVR